MSTVVVNQTITADGYAAGVGQSEERHVTYRVVR